ncbi:hypothetical protein MBLNU459_g3283t1 [Dothideomycetes sp. NU459]
MLVRESPKAKISPDKNLANWPPRSPFEALLSSPNGRKRWQEHRDRVNERSPSPSPLRRPLSSSKALQALAAESEGEGDEPDEDEDDDEETIQLKLQMLAAKLKLKKLQKAKSRQGELHGRGDAFDVGRSREASAANPDSPRKRQKTSASLEPSIQIELSPIKDRVAPQPHISPAKLLGIDKGLKAKDVSLKRPRHPALLARLQSDKAQTKSDTPKPSFSERIAASRLSNEEQQAKEDRIHRARSTGFGPTDPGQTTASQASAVPRHSIFEHSTRDHPSSNRNPGGNAFRRPAGSSADGPRSPFVSSRTSQSSTASKPSQSASTAKSTLSSERQIDENTSTEPLEDGSCFESFASLHLSRRKIPHVDLVRQFDSKELYPISRLLKEVKAPHYDPPDCETDFIVFAIIANKSTPYDTRPKNHIAASTTNEDEELSGRTKFMVLKLTDLKWEIDLFLFDTAFDRFWKITPGTLVAILNPAIMPPKTNQHSGRFSLKLASSEDSVLELGTARDLGFCESIKKDGTQCTAWVNSRKTKFCDYHVELSVSKARAGRMEVNGMFRQTGNPGAFKQTSRTMRDGDFARHASGQAKDAESGAHYFIGGKTGFSAARLFDAEDLGKADAMRKRLADKEKDRVLAEKLGRLGNGMGAEYLRSTNPTNADGTTRDADGVARDGAHDLLPPPKPDAAALGLLSNRASDVRLSPVRGRKRPFAATASGSSRGPEAMGWGGANKRGLLDPKPSSSSSSSSSSRALQSPEKGQTTLKMAFQREESPTKKKARFVLDKGIREPGRESLGDLGAARMKARVNVPVDDDSDDLEIV